MIKNFIILISIVLIIASIYKVYEAWKKLESQVEEIEFQATKWALTTQDTCCICFDKLDLEQTQKIIVVDGKHYVCCIRHDKREVTEFMKRGKLL